MIALCSCGNYSVRAAFQVSAGARCGETEPCREAIRQYNLPAIREATDAARALAARVAEFEDAKRERKASKNKRRLANLAACKAFVPAKKGKGR